MSRLDAVVVQYGMGNLRSVCNAVEAIGREIRIAARPEDLLTADRIILPGVGAFGDGMRNLREGGWIEALEREVRQKGKPFLGLCLGMQLLATTGTEHGRHEGLGWVAGVADRISAADGIRIPHIGWNDVRFTRRDGVFAGLGEAASFYFVHSYVLRPDDPGVVSGVCDYAGEFVACVEVDNLVATQFHPEKSQKAGLAVLRSFFEKASSSC